MDLFLFIGIFLGIGAIVVGMVAKGASIAVLINPEAVIIIFVGIIAAIINSYPSKELKRIPKILGVLVKNQHYDYAGIIQEIVTMSNLARRNGLLALEDPVQKLENPFLKNGLEMVVDGIEPEQIREIMENEIEGVEERHRVGAGIFKTAGSTSPTLGVLGAVIGLIGALGNLNNVDALGHSISSAFVATLFGIFFGYVILIPFSSRLTVKSEQEMQELTLILEGVMAIQTGQSSKSIEKKLFSMLDPKDRAADSDENKEDE